MAATALPASAQIDMAATAGDSTVLEKRTFMGQQVMAQEPARWVEQPSWWSKVRASGSIQTEFQIPYDIKGRFTEPYDGCKKVLNNTYFDFTVSAPYISVGARFEWAKWPLPGYSKDFDGWGVPYIWATGQYKWFQITAGDFYEQFGSGLILRTYQERSLGVDNAIRGGRIKLNPTEGLYITALGGKQRRYWEHNSSWLWGADAEWSLDESFRKAFKDPYGLTLGFSYVGKHEKDEFVWGNDFHHRLNLPKNIAAFDARAKVRLHDFSILAEWATKNNDPNTDNGYTYRRGHAELLSVTYASKGFSAYIQAKRSDNMSFRSKRSEDLIETASFINHMPAFTLTQTYTLAALYPYSTQKDGEWAFQAELRYLFKKGTPLGGKYGTNVRVSASYISGLDRKIPKGQTLNDRVPGSNNFSAPFWKIGKLYYSDLNVEINHKFSRKLQLSLFYLFQKFDQMVVDGHPGMNTAHIFIHEGQWKMAKKAQLRWELQYLHTEHDKGDWLAALAEVSFAPHWMITLTDTWNSGLNDNYYQVLLTYSVKSNRLTFGYGRIRAGYNCSGGVCRWVPETKGFNVGYSFTF